MNKNRKRLSAVTLGCKVNQYDTNSVIAQFLEAGYTLVNSRAEADVYIINTCTVTNLGDRKSRQMIRRAHRKNPAAKIVAMGCLAQTNPDQIRAIEGVSLIIGTSGREDIVEKVEGLPNSGQSIYVEDIFQVSSFEDLPALDYSGRTRAILKIQDGCSQFCTYCRVPFARGPSRSRKPESVLRQAEQMVAAGFKEIVLTGIHLGLYGSDLEGAGSDLAGICRQIADIPGLMRLRISSVDPHEIAGELIDLVAEHPVLCRHLHIPLQSGSDGVLRRMKRNYTSGEFESIVRRVRRRIPNAAITTDIMVGFPGETDAEFRQTEDLAKKTNFSKIHVFQYSKRKGTAAAEFPQQVPANVKESRSKCLIKIGKASALGFHKSFICQKVEVLVEQQRGGKGIGHTDNYLLVRFPVDEKDDLVGRLAVIEVTGANEKGAVGRLVQ